MKICAQSLVLELTRRCNGGRCYGDGTVSPCEHCLRGNPQSLSMTEEIIRRTSEEVDSVGCLCLSGGEPTLVPRLIKAAFEHLRNYSSFYIVTNGVRYSPSTVRILTEAYQSLEDYEQDLCGLSVSRDFFHGANNEAYYRYCDLEFFRNSHEFNFYDPNSIINEGLALENGIGGREVFPSLELEIHDDLIVVGSDLYINAKGDVIPGCNFSYSSQEKHKIGNIVFESLESILLRYVESNSCDKKSVHDYREQDTDAA